MLNSRKSVSEKVYFFQKYFVVFLKQIIAVINQKLQSSIKLLSYNSRIEIFQNRANRHQKSLQNQTHSLENCAPVFSHLVTKYSSGLAMKETLMHISQCLNTRKHAPIQIRLHHFDRFIFRYFKARIIFMYVELLQEAENRKIE